MQVTLGGKVAIGGAVTVAAIAVLYTISLGTNIDYWNEVFMSTSGDSMTPTWGPTSDGTTDYDDGTGTVTINGWIVTPLADGEQIFTGRNTQLIRLSVLDFATKTNTRFVSVNHLDGYGGSGDINAPAGWHGMETSGGFSDSAHSFHVIGGVSISGYRFFIQQRNGGTGDVGPLMFPPDDTSPYAHGINASHAFKDTISTQGCSSNVVTLTFSTTHTLSAGDDVWVHGANTNNGVKTSIVSATHSPEAITYNDTCTNVGPTASAGTVSLAKTDGDPVECDAPMAGAACTYAGYTAGMMWRGTEALKMQNLHPYVYGQDGGGTGPDGSGTWCYFYSYNGYQYLHRITCANLTGTGWTNPANWTHYNCPGGTVPNTTCDGLNATFWDALSANSTPITGLGISTGQNEGPIVYRGGVYYMLLNLYQAGGFPYDAIGLNTSPTPWGPWTLSANTPVPGGDYQAMAFPTFLFPMFKTLTSTSFSVPMMADSNTAGHPSAGSPILNLMTIHHP